MDLSVRRDFEGRDDQSWLGSAHGTSSAQSITLQMSSFTAATHFPNGYLPSGLPLGKYTSGANAGKYGPVTDAAADGSQVLAGFLFTAVAAPRSTTATVVNGALLDHGRVILARLPIAPSAAAQATNTHVIYV
jgi:hypothetical protein